MVVVTTQRDGDIAVLELRRPKVLNAIDQATVDALNAELDDIEEGPARALVITGTGDAFSAGADMKAAADDKMKRQRDMYALGLRLAAFPKVSIAAVNGLALGGGLELALYCTLRVASPNATFGFPEVHRSLMPGYGGTQLLPRLVGREHALNMLLTGDPIDADRALAIGLISALAADVVSAGAELACRCSAAGDRPQQAIRRAVVDGAGLPLQAAFDLESDLIASLIAQPQPPLA